MTDIRPAWSEPFLDGALGPAPHIRLPAPATRRWAYGDGRGAGVRVAVVDSGVDAGHPAVGGVAAAVDIGVDRDGTRDVVVTEGPHDDRFGHGTACAGIIRSLAPGVELISVRVLSGDLRGSATCFAAGIDWCIRNEIDVVNMSLSTSNPDYLETFWELVDRATFRRVALVSAMSNERKRTIPSEFAGVFSVACGPGDDLESIWFNPDGPAEWGATGLELDVAWSGGRRLRASGNSFASAVVAGHVARIIGAHPGITPWQARTVLAAVAANTAPAAR